jgi:dihydropteroate synthase
MDFDTFHAWLCSPALSRQTLIMGVLNVTPDSFSDGGQFDNLDTAVAHARCMVEAGAALLDVGGESTRPGSLPVAAQEQVARVIPVVQGIAELRLPVTISIDTTRSDVAAAALDAGAHVVNDISAGRDDPAMLPLVAGRQAPIVLMHMQGTPATMQVDPHYADVTAEVIQFLQSRVAAAVDAGVSRHHVLIDPGIGFGKTVEHNLELLRRLREVCEETGLPVILGTSRKGFIGRITGEAEPSRRLFGTAATLAWGIANGARVLRVHDVGPMAQVAAMMQAILNGGRKSEG